MIKDDVLVLDCVAHPFNFDMSNALGQPGELFRQHLYAFHNVLMPESEPKLSAEEFLKEWSTAEIARMVFDESDTDMLVAMPLPLTDLFHDGLSPWERCAKLRDALTGVFTHSWKNFTRICQETWICYIIGGRLATRAGLGWGRRQYRGTASPLTDPLIMP